VSVRPYLKGAFHSDWKLLMGLVPHGRKYGRMAGDGVRIDGSWGTIMGIARIRSYETFANKIARLKDAGVLRTGQDPMDRSGHFVVDVHQLISGNYFNASQDFVEKYAYPYQGNEVVCGDNNNHYLDTVSNTFWHRGFGNAKAAVIAAVADLGGRARTSEIAIKMGRVDENGKAKSGSISGTIKELCGKDIGVLRRVSHGVYELTEDVVQTMYEAVKSNEYLMDEKYRFDLEKRRRKYKEDIMRFRRENWCLVQWYMAYQEGGGTKGIKGWLKHHSVKN
jgi:hypothetical protein